MLRDELGFTLVTTDVDALAAEGDNSLRAQYGDLLPVVLLDGTEHSYWRSTRRSCGVIWPLAPRGVWSVAHRWQTSRFPGF